MNTSKSDLKDRIQADLYQAMRNRDKIRISVLRMLRSSIGYEEIETKAELKDVSVIDIISRQVRQRRESINIYREGGRNDLVDKESEELSILQEYLPLQLTTEELTNLARDVIIEIGATTLTDKGKVMGQLMPQVRGKADGNQVNEVVTALLNQVN